MCLQAFLVGVDVSPEQKARFVDGARKLGAAFQKVNFLRDLSADVDALGRSYFPGVDIATFTEADKQRLVADIDADLAVSAAIVPELPRSSRKAVALAQNLFAALNRRIEKTPAHLLKTTRVSVPTLTKQGLRGIPAERLNALLGDAPRAHEVAIDRATARMIGHIDALAKTAMLSPNLRTRAFIQSGGKAGTVPGEMWRMLFLFKSFPLAVVDKHVQRIRNIPSTSGKAAYSAALLTSLTMFGAIALQLKDLINGKDPRDMTTPKFWGAAFMQGGGLGIFGDMLYTAGGGNARGGQANWTGLAGPVFGTAFDAADVTLGNAVRASQGKDVDLGADVLRLGKQNTPFVNLWYARGAIDHLVLHDLQEQASPGYLRRMRQRARKDWGQRYWWEPGEPMPERAPDFEAVTGKD
jgi:hypothetical protein